MKGAITGDVIGSVFEFNPIKKKEFDLFYETSRYTDDSVLTMAVADSLLHGIPYWESFMRWSVNETSRGFGGGFFKWLFTKDKQPYNSLGNGAAMRISPIGFFFNTEEDVLREAKKCCDVTHNHPEGVKAGQAVAMAIYLARNGKSKKEIRQFIEKSFGYDVSRKLDDIRPDYRFTEKSPESVPEAIICFLESDSYEDAVRNAISLGGDADTQACIAGAIAEAFYGIDEKLWDTAKGYLSEKMVRVVEEFYGKVDLKPDAHMGTIP